MNELDNKEVLSENEEVLELLSENEEESVTGKGGVKVTTKNYTVRLKKGQSKAIWGIISYFLNYYTMSGSDLISTSYWGGRAGVKITCKSKKSGVAKVHYQETNLLDKFYEGTITVYCN